MVDLPSLDAHAHIDARRDIDLHACGMVLAQTISLPEAERALGRDERCIAWGIGCHPRDAEAHGRFDRSQLASLMERTAVVGEIGLDAGSTVPAGTQLATFRAILRVVADRPRVVSIHSTRAAQAVLDELRDAHVIAPILHWWNGGADETSEAVRIGCYFSVHAAVARRSVWHTRVPLDRILVESDLGWRDPPAAIPMRVGWVEHLLAQQYGISQAAVREAAWRSLARIVDSTGTLALLPPGIAGVLARMKEASRV